MNHKEIGKIVERALSEKESILIYKHIDSVIVSPPHFSQGKVFRYKLEISKPLADNAVGNTVCAIMQNPSYANEDIADKSVIFLEQLIFEKGIDAFNGVNKLIIINQFAFVQTNGFEGSDDKIGPENDTVITQVINDSDIIIIAWGATNNYNDRKNFINRILLQEPNQSKTKFETKKHPSRGFYNNFLTNYTPN